MSLRAATLREAARIASTFPVSFDLQKSTAEGIAAVLLMMAEQDEANTSAGREGAGIAPKRPLGIKATLFR